MFNIIFQTTHMFNITFPTTRMFNITFLTTHMFNINFFSLYQWKLFQSHSKYIPQNILQNHGPQTETSSATPFTKNHRWIYWIMLSCRDVIITFFAIFPEYNLLSYTYFHNLNIVRVQKCTNYLQKFTYIQCWTFTQREREHYVIPVKNENGICNNTKWCHGYIDASCLSRF